MSTSDGAAQKKVIQDKIEAAEIKNRGDIIYYGFGIRHVQALLIFIYLIITFIARGHLGVTIVAMVDHPGRHRSNTSQVDNNVFKVNINNEILPTIATYAEYTTYINNYTITDTIYGITDDDVGNSTIILKWGEDIPYVNTDTSTYDPTTPDYHYEISSNGRILFLKKVDNPTNKFTPPINYNKNMQFTEQPHSENVIIFNNTYKLTKISDDNYKAISFDITTPSMFSDSYLTSLSEGYDEDDGTSVFKRADMSNNNADQTVRERFLPKHWQEEDSWNIFVTYKWKKSHQESIQGAFFLGYFILMLPMGMVTQRYGGKIPMQISLFVNGVVSLITPWAIAWGGWQAACVCRIIQGLSQTGTYPAAISMCAAWIPLSERGSLSTYIFSGTIIGTVVAFQVAGFLVSTSWGWPSMFWFTSALCLLGFVLITMFSSATPDDNKYISEAEKMFILGSTSGNSVKKTKVPWKEAFTSKHVWAIFATHVGSGVSFFFLFTQVPSYLHYILGFNVKESGLLSSLPYIANFFASLLFGFLSDYCSNRNYISVKNTRILYNSIACFGMAANLFLVSFFKSKALCVACFILALLAHGGIHVGWMINYMDICPNYSSSLVAVGNTMMNFVMIIMPMFISRVIVDVTSVTQWRVMLLLIGFATVICNVIFICFMSSDVQPWNNSYQLASQDLESGIPKKESIAKETPKCSLSPNADFD